MRLQQKNFLMGAALSVFLPLVAVSPSMAQSTQDGSNSIQSNYSQSMYGTVRTISDNTVRIAFANRCSGMSGNSCYGSSVQSFRLTPGDMARLNLSYGTPVYVTMLPDGNARIALTSSDMNSAMSSTYSTGMSSSSLDSMNSSNMPAGTAMVTAVNDNIITVRTPNGDTKQFLIPREQIQIMSLQPGTQMVILGDRLSADRVIVGDIKQIVGNIATIQDQRGDIHDVKFSRTRIESLNLRPGERVAVAEGGFDGPSAVFLMPQVDANNTSVYSTASSSTMSTQTATQMSDNDSAIATVVTEDQSAPPAPVPVDAQEENVPVAPAPAPAAPEQPIRAMW